VRKISCNTSLDRGMKKINVTRSVRHASGDGSEFIAKLIDIV
jgi:hypothetical protein